MDRFIASDVDPVSITMSAIPIPTTIGAWLAASATTRIGSTSECSPSEAVAVTIAEPSPVAVMVSIEPLTLGVATVRIARFSRVHQSVTIGIREVYGQVHGIGRLTDNQVDLRNRHPLRRGVVRNRDRDRSGTAEHAVAGRDTHVRRARRTSRDRQVRPCDHDGCDTLVVRHCAVRDRVTFGIRGIAREVDHFAAALTEGHGRDHPDHGRGIGIRRNDHAHQDAGAGACLARRRRWPSGQCCLRRLP